MPSLEEIQSALGKAENIDDFFGKESIVSQLFAQTMEEMLRSYTQKVDGLSL